ncbi:MAG: single-stranded DNA-binding protein [Spirochaetaceae bacterium]
MIPPIKANGIDGNKSVKMNIAITMLLEGNLVKDPVERRTPQDTIICNFTIAVNRSYKKDDDYVNEVSYFDIEV